MSRLTKIFDSAIFISGITVTTSSLVTLGISIYREEQRQNKIWNEKYEVLKSISPKDLTQRDANDILYMIDYNFTPCGAKLAQSLNKISLSHKKALMRFFYPNINVDKLTLDEYCQLESELIYLSEIGIIQVKLHGN